MIAIGILCVSESNGPSFAAQGSLEVAKKEGRNRVRLSDRLGFSDGATGGGPDGSPDNDPSNSVMNSVFGRASRSERLRWLELRRW